MPELEPIGSEAVGLQHLGAGLHVGTVEVAHHVGRADVELIIALIDEDAACVEHRPHGTVEQHERLRIDQPLQRRAATHTAASAAVRVSNGPAITCVSCLPPWLTTWLLAG